MELKAELAQKGLEFKAKKSASAGGQVTKGSTESTSWMKQKKRLKNNPEEKLRRAIPSLCKEDTAAKKEKEEKAEEEEGWSRSLEVLKEKAKIYDMMRTGDDESKRFAFIILSP